MTGKFVQGRSDPEHKSIGLVSTILSCLLVALILTACVSSEPPRPNFVRVTGIVKAPTHEPVAGAIVSTIPATISAITEADGTYILNNLNSPGKYVIQAVHDSTSNQPGRKAIVAVWGSQNVDLTLGVDSLDLENNSNIADPTAGPGKKSSGRWLIPKRAIKWMDSEIINFMYVRYQYLYAQPHSLRVPPADTTLTIVSCVDQFGDPVRAVKLKIDQQERFCTPGEEVMFTFEGAEDKVTIDEESEGKEYRLETPSHTLVEM